MPSVLPAWVVPLAMLWVAPWAALAVLPPGWPLVRQRVRPSAAPAVAPESFLLGR